MSVNPLEKYKDPLSCRVEGLGGLAVVSHKKALRFAKHSSYGGQYFLSPEILQSLPKWETDRKISCEQTLQKGDGPKTSWTRELTNDGQLILVIRLPGVS